jgi:hypothetical protein
VHVCAKRTMPQESFWKHPMALVGDEAQVEARFNLFGASTNLDARQVNGLPQMNHRLINLFGLTRWNSKVTWVMSNLVSVRLETVLVSVQDWCTNCAKHSIDSGIVLDAPEGTPR